MRSVRILKIDSDGMPQNTVVSLEDGTELKNVVYVNWSIRAGEHPSMDIEIIGGAIHTAGRLECTHFICQVCNATIEHQCE